MEHQVSVMIRINAKNVFWVLKYHTLHLNPTVLVSMVKRYACVTYRQSAGVLMKAAVIVLIMDQDQYRVFLVVLDIV
jgi:hypothetical protein